MAKPAVGPEWIHEIKHDSFRIMARREEARVGLATTVILMGAEIDAEMEHQTVRDTTVGLPEPLGARGATMADTVGAAQD